MHLYKGDPCIGVISKRVSRAVRICVRYEWSPLPSVDSPRIAIRIDVHASRVPSVSSEWNHRWEAERIHAWIKRNGAALAKKLREYIASSIRCTGIEPPVLRRCSRALCDPLKRTYAVGRCSLARFIGIALIVGIGKRDACLDAAKRPVSRSSPFRQQRIAEVQSAYPSPLQVPTIDGKNRRRAASSDIVQPAHESRDSTGSWKPGEVRRIEARSHEIDA